MARWLLKTEPDSYSWDDLVRDRRTTWDGVSNALALKHLRTMRPGDEAIVYHTGDEKAAVGIATVASAPYADPKEGDERLVVVDLKPVRKLDQTVTLSDIKADPSFEGWDLLRIGRLSVVPVPDVMWDRLLQLSEAGGPGTGNVKAPQARTGAQAAKDKGTGPRASRRARST